MTCPHCGFENTEDRESCFRCGQVLDLSGVEVIPPRLIRGRPGNRAVEAWVVWWNRHRPGPRYVERFSAVAVFLASVIPGLGHFLQGEVRLGGWLALLWLISVLATMLADLPVSYRPLLVWDWLSQPRLIPLSLHAWIMTDAWSRRVRMSNRRLRIAEVAILTLTAVVLLSSPRALGLLPVQDRFDQVAIQFALPEAGVQAGDRLLVDRDGEAGGLPVGALVLYRAPWVGVQGEMLGLVLAGPGSHLKWTRKTGTLFRDGRPIQVEGLSDMADGEVELEEGHLALLPAHRAGVKKLQELVLPAEEIRGVAVETVWPQDRRRNL